ncbi:MAG: GNAT family N-acetyltransferase [Anaerolineae bacterium]|jgi:N-acetylglutamate synthase-like GNAT family acetyltransferase|nr:GNAT family N-acetyltransferase [Anaerolineae bacterium]
MEEAVVTKVNIIIRKAQPHEIPALSDFIMTFVEHGTLLPRTLDELAELLENLFVAELDGEIVGCAALEIYSRKLAEIRSLAVSEKVRGRGVGKKLVKACIDLAMEKNVFEVMAISASDEFFRACGFDYTLPRLRRAFFLQTRDEL